jgi:hypothetical protein
MARLEMIDRAARTKAVSRIEQLRAREKAAARSSPRYRVDEHLIAQQ